MNREMGLDDTLSSITDGTGMPRFLSTFVPIIIRSSGMMNNEIKKNGSIQIIIVYIPEIFHVFPHNLQIQMYDLTSFIKTSDVKCNGPI